MTTKEVEYIKRPCIRRSWNNKRPVVWETGRLIRVWKNGRASIQPLDMIDGWLIVRKGEWREIKVGLGGREA